MDIRQIIIAFLYVIAIALLTYLVIMLVYFTLTKPKPDVKSSSTVASKQFMIRSTDSGSVYKNILVSDDAGNLDVTAIDDLPFNIKTIGNINGNTITGTNLNGTNVNATNLNGTTITGSGNSKLGGINFTNNNWTDSARNTTSEICNDTTNHKALMIVGNSSGGTRKVKMWDEVTVNGTFCIGNTCITEDDLKKIKNNSFPNLQVGGKTVLTTGSNYNINNIFTTNEGYLHNRGDFQQRNGVYIGFS